ncbi:MAG: gliding motility protein GldC [Chloroflexota bacterium]|nr:MAG: gliding motility protein GldC [Chloroflexota bacterium]
MILRIFITTQNISQLDNGKNISKIEIEVELDNNKVPEKLDGLLVMEILITRKLKLLFIRLGFKNQESLRIDLWTKDMPLDEMKLFFYQTLLSMSTTFKRATSDEKMSQTMADFCDYFAEKLELKK